jgi:hypothetical protein
MRKVILSSFLTVSIFLSALLLIFGAVPYAKATLTSTNVVFVPSASCPTGGTLPTTNPAFAAFNFSTMAWANVNAANLAPYDTVVLMISTETVPLSTSQQADLINWVDGGGKLIIYDSETVPSVDYSWLPYPMTTKNPGAMGYASGNITFVENNTLGCTDPGNVTYYIHTTIVPTGGWSDSVGDCNTFVTSDPHWYGHIKAQNYYSYTPSPGYDGTPAGWVHTYAPYGNGLFIYNGFDIDPLASNSVPNSTVLYDGNLAKIWLMELKQPWGIHYNLPETKGAMYYDVTIKAYCYTEDTYVSVSITMDGTPTGFNTPYVFTDLNGTHTFTVPGNDPNGHPFKQWNTGETSTTITVSSARTYTAYYYKRDVAVVNVALSKTVVGQGYSLSINVTVENQGVEIIPTPEQRETFWSMGDVNRDGYIDDIDVSLIGAAWLSTPGAPNWNPDADLNKDLIVDADDLKILYPNYGLDIWTHFGLGLPTETFNVTAYTNTTAIETQTITNLPAGATQTLTFTWNTSGFAEGNYTISAIADTVPGETDTADNSCTDGWVKVTVAGDINGDGIVNAGDLGLLGTAWFSNPNSPNWNPNADITGNEIVNAGDLGIIGVNWFKT